MEYECSLDLNKYSDGKSAKVTGNLTKSHYTNPIAALAAPSSLRNRRSVGTIEMLISLNQNSTSGKMKLAKKLSDFERNKGLMGKMRSFGSVKLVILSARGQSKSAGHRFSCFKHVAMQQTFASKLQASCKQVVSKLQASCKQVVSKLQASCKEVASKL